MKFKRLMSMTATLVFLLGGATAVAQAPVNGGAIPVS